MVALETNQQVFRAVPKTLRTQTNRGTALEGLGLDLLPSRFRGAEILCGEVLFACLGASAWGAQTILNASSEEPGL